MKLFKIGTKTLNFGQDIHGFYHILLLYIGDN